MNQARHATCTGSVAIAVGMGVGITLDRLGAPVIGVHVAIVVFQIAWALQVGWLWWRSRTAVPTAVIHPSD